MINRRLFADDDYTAIVAKYFADLRQAGLVDADPSGWLFTYSEAEPWVVRPKVKARDIARYYIDEREALGVDKEKICALISAWEKRPVSANTVTVCPSGGCASLITLAALKAAGVRRILFETPAYFGTIEQAVELGLKFELVPTYARDGFELPKLASIWRDQSSTALWVTQPRASLGFNQSLAAFENFLRAHRRHYLVIDEATDQSFPAHLGSLSQNFSKSNLVRLRSFTKGMGLNGFRLAAVIHPAALRAQLVGSVEALGGSLDVHSLKAVAAMADDIPRLKSMLAAANGQVVDLRAKAERLVAGSPLRINHLVNGYIGSLLADLSLLGKNHRSARRRLLEGCREVRTPVMLGATMYLAADPPTEAIRLNFFSHPEHVTRGIANILRIW